MQERYVVIKHRGNDEFIEVLPYGATLVKGIETLEHTWYSMCEEDQKKSVVELCCLAYDEEVGELVLDDAPNGYQCLSNYNWIVKLDWEHFKKS